MIQMIGPGAGPAAAGSDRREVEVSISIRTILAVAAILATALALASIGDVLLLFLVSMFSIAVLSPVVDTMERRLSWGRAPCATLLVLGIVILGIAFAVVLLQAVVDGLGSFSDALPGLIGKARHSDLGSLVNGPSEALDVLKEHSGEITSGLGKASGGLAHVGVSAFGAVTLIFSVTFLTLFGLIDEPRMRTALGGLLYRDSRERCERLTDRIIGTTSRYMLGNIAISLICGTVYGVAALILGLPHALALAMIAGVLDLVPYIGALLAGIIIGIVALSVSVGALIAIVIVIVLYQLIENYVLQPTIIGRAARVSGFTVIISVLVFGSLFGVIGAIIGVPIAAALQIVAEELTAGRRARVVAADAGDIE
jgi:predicted PurR-regulated permease PerM